MEVFNTAEGCTGVAGCRDGGFEEVHLVDGGSEGVHGGGSEGGVRRGGSVGLRVGGLENYKIQGAPIIL